MQLAVYGEFTVTFINWNINQKTSQKHNAYFYTKSKMFLYTFYKMHKQYITLSRT